jgi:trk system potassium uptake protein TrkH
VTVTTAVARLRRGARRDVLGIDVGGTLNLVGAIMKYFSAAFFLPIGIALGYGESPWPFVAGGLLTAGTGWALELVTEGKERIGPREGFLVVSLAWLFGAFFVSLPYVFDGVPDSEGTLQLRNPLDAYFEAMSGMTTTGASVLTDIPAMDHSVAMWRQFSQWLGGMGIIVLALAVLPRLRVGGRQLLESEAPGPELDPLATSIRETARRLWITYVALSAAMVVALTAIAWTGLDEAMSFYEAVAHAFTTLPTGGFSTRARSIEEFGTASQWTIMIFMAVGGANFALTYRALLRRQPGPLVRDEELRLYIGLLALATIVLFADLVSEGIESGETAIRHAAFEAVAVMTTTGYAVTDYAAEWTSLAAIVLVALMLIGGSAGSTAGAMKPIRILLLGRVLRRELDQTVHPQLVLPIRFNGRVVDERTLRAVVAFVALYVVVFAVGALVIAVDSGRANLNVSAFDAIGASAAAIGNVGPAFGFAGPMGSFDPFSPLSKGVMIALMWMGRLELIPVAVLLTRSYWRA